MLSISRNVRSCAGVLHATLDTLSDYTSSDDLGVSAGDGPAACAVRYDPLTREQKEKQATWCHACVLDASDGIWTVASTLEGDDWVLMAMKGSLSKQSNLLERMCLYRMQLPKELFSTELSLQLKRQLMPKLRADDLSMEERRAKMMVRIHFVAMWPYRRFGVHHQGALLFLVRSRHTDAKVVCTVCRHLAIAAAVDIWRPLLFN